MRRSLLLACSALGVLLAVEPVAAKTLDWDGTLTLDLGPLGSSTSIVSSHGPGVAVVAMNVPTLTNNLRTLQIPSASLSITQTAPVDPSITATIAKLEIDPVLSTDTFANISGTGPIQPATLPLVGLPRVCFVAGCTAPATMMAVTPSAAIGAGGTFTLTTAGTLSINMVAAPWTVETATATTQTASGALVAMTAQGSLLGTGSGTARTSNSVATPSGVIQFVTPIQISTVGLAGNHSEIAGFATLTLHFVPEPGLLLLLGSGAVGLAILGRRRHKS